MKTYTLVLFNDLTSPDMKSIDIAEVAVVRGHFIEFKYLISADDLPEEYGDALTRSFVSTLDSIITDGERERAGFEQWFVKAFSRPFTSVRIKGGEDGLAD